MQKAAKEKAFLLFFAIASALFICAPTIASSTHASTAENRIELFLLEGQNRTGQQAIDTANRVENYDSRWGVALESPVAPRSLLDDIVDEANLAATPGHAISDSQRTLLRQNLPVVQRRSAFQNRILRKEFTRDQARHIADWERMTGQTWPAGATPHHIIPLESGGANAAFNLVPTHGALPNHSLPGVPGPHAKGGVLRESVQQPRSILPPGQPTDLRQRR